MYIDRKNLDSENRKVIRCFLRNQHNTNPCILRHEHYIIILLRVCLIEE